MSAWQPIDSAPKDGTPILLFREDWRDEGVFIGRWCHQQYERWDRVDATTQKLAGMDDYSAFHGSSVTGVCVNEPTHWMPLPDPPEAP